MSVEVFEGRRNIKNDTDESVIPQFKIGISEKLSHVPEALQVFSSNHRKYILREEI